MLGGGYGGLKNPTDLFRRGGWQEWVFFETPYGAPEHRKALGERPEGVAHRDVRDWPTRQDASLGQRRDPKLRSGG